MKADNRSVVVFKARGRCVSKSVLVLGLFVLATIGQVAGVSLLPLTHAFTRPLATVGCLGTFIFGVWMMALILNSGANLSVAIPVMSATVPLGVIAIAALVYGEPLPVLKLCLLVASIGLIGLASALK
jgi:multidrug transporter EmrE-like cation transporter